MYLSSFRFGDKVEKLFEMLGENKQILLIQNSLDFSDDKERLENGLNEERQRLMDIGLKPIDLDLRAYFGKKKELEELVNKIGAVWVRGGDTFVLRRAMYDSGFDEIVKSKLFDKNFFYGGYSAGICLLAPDITIHDIVDDSARVMKAYGKEPIFTGLNIFPYNFQPHYDSGHEESEGTDKEIQYAIDNKIPFVALRDGDVIIFE